MGNIDIRGFFQRYGWFLLLAAVAFLGAYLFIGRKAKPSSQSGSPNGSVLMGQDGSTGQPVVEYVPTTGDSYTNVNYQYDSGNIANTTSTINNTTIPPNPPPARQPPVQPPPIIPPPIRPPILPPPSPIPPERPPLPPVHPPPPAPPPTQGYTVVHGDTLSGIASRFHTTWQTLYMMNKSIIDSWAARYKSPIPGGPWNNIFPNEPLIVPRH